MTKCYLIGHQQVYCTLSLRDMTVPSYDDGFTRYMNRIQQ